jgi:hypothetical protein
MTDPHTDTQTALNLLRDSETVIRDLLAGYPQSELHVDPNALTNIIRRFVKLQSQLAKVSL